MVELTDEEIKNANLKRVEFDIKHISLYKGRFRGLIGYFIGKKVVDIYNGVMFFGIDVRNNDYMGLVKNSGNKLEKEYDKRVEIRDYSSQFI